MCIYVSDDRCKGNGATRRCKAACGLSELDLFSMGSIQSEHAELVFSKSFQTG